MDKFIEKLRFEKINKMILEPIHIFFFICILTFVIILMNNDKMNMNNFLNSISASFVGAGSAFFLNTFYSKKKKRLENIAILEKSKYTINVILGINKQIKEHIEKFRDIPNDHFFEWEKIPEYDSNFPHINIDIQNLLFLLDVRKIGKETLNSILLVDAEMQDVTRTLEKRNEMFSSYLEKTKYRDSLEKSDLEEVIGIKLVKYLERYTQHLIEINVALLEDSEKSIKKIDEFLKIY